MRVLVTGHHGYIGSVLAPIVADAGHEVIGLDTYYYRSCDFGGSSEWTPSQSVDVRDVQRPFSGASMPSFTSPRSPTTPSAT